MKRVKALQKQKLVRKARATAADAAPATETPVDTAELVKQLGDNVNTRMRGGDNADIDEDLDDDWALQKAREAEQATGFRHKDIASTLPFSAETAPSVSTFIGHNRFTVTAVCAHQVPIDSRRSKTIVFFGDKRGCVFRCESKAEVGYTEKPGDMATGGQLYSKTLMEPACPAGITSIAVSDTTHAPTNLGGERTSADLSILSYLVSGCADGSMSVWNTRNGQHIGNLKMHSGPVTGLDFRGDTHTCYSVAADGCLRVWSIPEMYAVDKFFGHVGSIQSISALRKERCVTGGVDRTVRYWKIDAATQFDFSKQTCSMECVAMIDDNLMLGGSLDGTLSVFDVSRRGPLFQIPYAHGYGDCGDGTGLEREAILDRLRARAEKREDGGSGDSEQKYPWLGNGITAVAAVPFSDVVASGSHSGSIIVWRLTGHATTVKGMHSNKLTLEPLTAVNQKGVVNCLRFSPNSSILFACMGKEERLGRWKTVSDALNGVLAVPITPAAIDSVRNGILKLDPKAKFVAAPATSIAKSAAKKAARVEPSAGAKTPVIVRSGQKVLDARAGITTTAAAATKKQPTKAERLLAARAAEEAENGEDEEDFSDDYEDDGEDHPMMMGADDGFDFDGDDEEDDFDDEEFGDEDDVEDCLGDADGPGPVGGKYIGGGGDDEDDEFDEEEDFDDFDGEDDDGMFEMGDDGQFKLNLPKAAPAKPKKSLAGVPPASPASAKKKGLKAKDSTPVSGKKKLLKAKSATPASSKKAAAVTPKSSAKKKVASSASPSSARKSAGSPGSTKKKLLKKR